MPYSKRRCTGSPTCPEIVAGRDRYCPEHQAEYEARRGTTTQRGYGRTHQTLRKQWQDKLDAGEDIRCWRCGTPVDPARWHLGHDDHDRSKHRGPECIGCNTSTAGRR